MRSIDVWVSRVQQGPAQNIMRDGMATDLRLEGGAEMKEAQDGTRAEIYVQMTC